MNYSRGIGTHLEDTHWARRYETLSDLGLGAWALESVRLGFVSSLSTSYGTLNKMFLSLSHVFLICKMGIIILSLPRKINHMIVIRIMYSNLQNPECWKSCKMSDPVSSINREKNKDAFALEEREIEYKSWQ